jgi:formylglycine-generating enzyme required for sulfatase activity
MLLGKENPMHWNPEEQYCHRMQGIWVMMLVAAIGIGCHHQCRQHRHPGCGEPLASMAETGVVSQVDLWPVEHGYLVGVVNTTNPEPIELIRMCFVIDSLPGAHDRWSTWQRLNLTAEEWDTSVAQLLRSRGWRVSEGLGLSMLAAAFVLDNSRWTSGDMIEAVYWLGEWRFCHICTSRTGQVIRWQIEDEATRRTITKWFFPDPELSEQPPWVSFADSELAPGILWGRTPATDPRVRGRRAADVVWEGENRSVYSFGHFWWSMPGYGPLVRGQVDPEKEQWAAYRTTNLVVPSKKLMWDLGSPFPAGNEEDIPHSPAATDPDVGVEVDIPKMPDTRVENDSEELRPEGDGQDLKGLVYSRWPFDSAEAKRRQQETARALGVPVEKTLDLGGGEKLELVLLPAGEFVMGSPADEDGRGGDEGPQRRVTLSRPFYMSVTEVTQSQYEAVTGESPWKGESRAKENGSHAASYVSWNDAQTFCQTLSRRSRETLRLPTEAQWEYACRSGSSSAYHFGDDAEQLGQYAWYRDNAWDVGEKYAHSVAQKKPNAFGLYDMHGNVCEWCDDWYGDKYDPQDTTSPKGPGSGRNRVLRLGGWGSIAMFCRSACRVGFSRDSRGGNGGFRVVVVVGGRRGVGKSGNPERNPGRSASN